MTDVAPDFIIIGACKSGTTTLYDDLAKHPNAAMPDDKEPDILHKAANARHAQSLWQKHFRSFPESFIKGEGSTHYTMMPDYPDVSRLARDAMGPTGKIVYIIRDPITRIESNLAHDFSVGRIDSADFDRLALQESRYIAWSDYATQIRPWIEAFGRASLLAIIFEDFVINRNDVARDVARFVGLDATRLPNCSGISNRRGSQYALRSPLLSGFIRGPLYRQHLRNLVPKSVRDSVRNSISRKIRTPQVRLSHRTVLEIRSRLRNLEADLRDLHIAAGNWFTNRD